MVVPAALRPAVLEILHGAHQGEKGMRLRAQESVWWPGITPQIKEKRDTCRTCNETAPSQPAAPPDPVQHPNYPFQQVASDYFMLGGHTYLVIVDRFSGWPVVVHCGNSTGSSGMLMDRLREYFATFGIPEELATDGGLTYMSYETQQFLRDYGVKHRLSSVAFAQSNKRAELGCKSMKRLLRENTSGDGSLNNDRFLRALMVYRNTPDRDTKRSPAQVVFGRCLRDFLPAPQTRYRVHPEWMLLREDREKALAKRSVSNMERLGQNTKALPRLGVGDCVLIQNQVGNHPSRWDITGRVVEVKDHDQYVVRVDGSGRLTMRNRRFLRRLTPYSHGMMRPAEPAATGYDAAPAPAAPPSSAPSSETPHRGGSSHSGEPVNFGHPEFDNNPVSPPHVTTELREPREPEAGDPGAQGDRAAPEAVPPEAATAPATAPPPPTGRPVRERRPVEKLNISSWNTKSYTSATTTRPLTQSAWDTSFSLGWGRGGGITDRGTRPASFGSAAGSSRPHCSSTGSKVAAGLNARLV